MKKKVGNNKERKENIIEEKEEHMKTLLDIINDTENGIPMSKEKNTKLENIKNFSSPNSKSKKDSRTISVNNSYSISDKNSMLKQKNERAEIEKIEKFEKESNNYKRFFKPKVVIDESGKLIIEKPNISEISQRISEEQSKKNDIPIIEYNSNNLKLSSSSFKKPTHSDKWNEPETQLFYKALECFGTDFSLLELVLAPRNRIQIKNKYRKEEKNNLVLIENSLKKFDPNKFKKLLGVLKNTINNKKNCVDFKKLLNDDEEELNKINDQEQLSDIETKLKNKNSDSESEHEESGENISEEENPLSIRTVSVDSKKRKIKMKLRSHYKNKTLNKNTNLNTNLPIRKESNQRKVSISKNKTVLQKEVEEFDFLKDFNN